MSADLTMHTGNFSFLVPHAYPGRLVVAEGLDGSGKSTQLQLLRFWLRSEGYETVLTKWNSSKLIKQILKAGKKRGYMDPALLSILHAADLAELYQCDIVPALKRGAIVLADRYVYAALARDLARGVERDWTQQVYQFAARPDLVIYFHLSAEQSLERTLSEHLRVKYYQAGMDLRLSSDPIDSFRAFQQCILDAYETMINGSALLRLDATLPVQQQQRLLRTAVELLLPHEG